jgi:hypothetical protein
MIFFENDFLVAASNSFDMTSDDEVLTVRLCERCFSASICWANPSSSSGSQMFTDCDQALEPSGVEGAGRKCKFDFDFFLIRKGAAIAALSITSFTSLSGVVDKVNSLGVADVRVVTDVPDRSSLSVLFCLAFSDMMDRMEVLYTVL